jgi:hypothetical protein
LYSPVSWLLALRILSADEALEPTVSTRSKPGCATSLFEEAEPGREFSSLGMLSPGRRAKGFRIGIVAFLQRIRYDNGGVNDVEYAKQLLSI